MEKDMKFNILRGIVVSSMLENDKKKELLEFVSGLEEMGGMTGNEYQRLAMRTCSTTDPAKQMMHSICGLASETGEVAGIMQKKYQGHKFDREHMAKELGDCLWMIAEACTSIDMKMEEVMQMNIDKLRARYPEGFSAERSLHRDKNDI